MTLNEGNNKTCFWLLALLMVVLTVANIGATYYIVKQDTYEPFGSKETYEKFLLVSQLQYTGLKDKNMDELKKEVNDALKAQGSSPIGDSNGPVVNSEIPDSFLSDEKIVFGKEDAPITIYEFSDLECPYCKSLHDTGIVKQAVADNSDSVNYVFKNFPLTQIHGGAEMKAQASLCVADEKGSEGYYTFIDGLFSIGTRASREDIVSLAEKLGISTDFINTCLDSNKNLARVNNDLSQGTSIFGATGTPTVVVVNNQTKKWAKLEERSLSGLQNIIDSLK